MNKPRYKAVILDIDDTLLITREPKWKQHIFVAKHYYNIDLSETDLRKHWGKPFDELAAALYQNNGTAKERRANFARHELEFPREYEPYALEALRALHDSGLVMGLLTAMYREGAMIDLKNIDLPFDWFEFVQGSEATPHHKPDGRVFDPALKTFEHKALYKSQIVYVGEALSDLRAAQDAGIDFIAITQGMVDSKTFYNAGAINVYQNLRRIADYILH